MTRILFISDNSQKVDYFNSVFKKNSYDFSSLSDEKLIYEIISAEMPDIIIIDSSFNNIKLINKKIKSVNENSIIIFLTNPNKIEKEIVKYANAFITEDMSEDLILSTISVNLRMKNALEML